MIDFMPLAMSDLRMRPGEILDRVADRGESFLIERNGQRKACLVPLSVFLPDVAPSRLAEELDELGQRNIVFTTTVTKNREVAICAPVAINETSFDVTVVLPHGYPHACPRVYVANIGDEKVPHRWGDGTLCLFGVMSTWNPGKHSVTTALELSERWLTNHAIWRESGSWPSIEVSHE